MNGLVKEFQKFAGTGTRQIGRYFCIPAVVNNALRVLGSDEYPQERIRDEWYAHYGRSIEPNIDDQMQGAGPNVIDVLKSRTEFSSLYESESFDLPPELSFFNAAKADTTVRFIVSHIDQGHPVLVSTDTIPWEQGIITRFCCHMWLVLSADTKSNMAVAHDPGTDLLFQIPIEMAVSLHMGANLVPLEIGLRGRLTTTNYCCAAFWKK